MTLFRLGIGNHVRPPGRAHCAAWGVTAAVAITLASVAAWGAAPLAVSVGLGAASAQAASSPAENPATKASGTDASAAAIVPANPFGTVWVNWTRFDDPAGLYALYTPPDWEWRQDKSEKGFAVFYGPGKADVFWVETFTLDYPQPPLTLLQGMFGLYANGKSALKNFTVIQNPATGYLDNLPMAYGVYRYTDDQFGETVEGVALVVWRTQVVAITFSDSPASFANQTPLFNQVLEGIRLHLLETVPAGSDGASDGAAGPTDEQVDVAPPIVF